MPLSELGQESKNPPPDFSDHQTTDGFSTRLSKVARPERKIVFFLTELWRMRAKEAAPSERGSRPQSHLGDPDHPEQEDTRNPDQPYQPRRPHQQHRPLQPIQPDPEDQHAAG